MSDEKTLDWNNDDFVKGHCDLIHKTAEKARGDLKDIGGYSQAVISALNNGIEYLYNVVCMLRSREESLKETMRLMRQQWNADRESISKSKDELSKLCKELEAENSELDRYCDNVNANGDLIRRANTSLRKSRKIIFAVGVTLGFFVGYFIQSSLKGF